ncbi:nuclear transport factor 2 family protein [Nocardia sp. NPDC020380]|uniref:nuclear transport factor 2 family protein n=1 Tax=Nocardia sp. NPDC020380 TaxID=3364309 RepID=UPI0037AE8512
MTTAATTGRDATIERVHTDFLAAVAGNDADAIAEFVTADWVFISSRGITPGSGFLDLVRTGALTHSVMTAVGEPRVRRYGDTAVLNSRVVNTVHYRDRTIEQDEWTTDVFVLDDGVWRCVVTHLTAAAQD